MSSQYSLKAWIKDAIRPLAMLILDLGIEPRRAKAVRHLPRYRAQLRKFSELGGKITHRYPVLGDYDDKAGVAAGHYFHQDLLVASFIHANNPVRHIDIGSRIDGFVAHVASFRRIEVMDVRELPSTGHHNISFIRADLMSPANAEANITDSISCLHAIEHFGLGRYGDPLDPNGHCKGYNNIVRMLSPGGTMYISFPIGRRNEVHFNAHRVFGKLDIFNWADDPASMELARFDFVDDEGDLHTNVDIHRTNIDVSFGCGIYTLKKMR